MQDTNMNFEVNLSECASDSTSYSILCALQMFYITFDYNYTKKLLNILIALRLTVLIVLLNILIALRLTVLIVLH